MSQGFTRPRYTNTSVAAATYGAADTVGTFVVGLDGRLTSAANVSIAIAASQVTSGSLAVARGGTGTSVYTTGDLLYSDAANSLAKLAANSTATKKFLSMTSSVPSWALVDAADITTGILPLARGGTNVGTVTANGVVVGNAGATAYATSANLTWDGTTLTTTGSTVTTQGATVGTVAGGGVFSLKPGSSADHTYIQFFARTATPTTRTAYLGFPAAASTQLALVNEVSGGALALSTTGTATMTLTSTTIALSGNQTVSGTSIVTGNVTITGGLTTLNNASTNRIDFGAVGTGAPTFTSVSAGAKLTLFNNLSGSSSTYSIGIESNHMWFGVSQASTGFKWYAGTTEVMRLSATNANLMIGTTTDDGVNRLQVSGAASVTGTTTLGANLTFSGTASILLNTGTAGAQQDLSFKKTGAISATNIQYTFSHRADNITFLIYGYDNTTFKTFFGFDYANSQTTVYQKLIPSANATFDIGSTSLRYLAGWFSGTVTAGAFDTAGSVTSTSTITSRFGVVAAAGTVHFTLGKASSPAASNPDFEFKMTNDAVPRMELIGWDGTTAKVFYRLNYTSGAVELGTGTLVGIANGGTGQTTASAAFDALSPMTTAGDIVYGGVAGSGTRLAPNASATKMFLQMTSSAPTWGALVAADIPSLPASIITSGTISIANGGTGQTSASAAFNALSPITTSGDIIVSFSGATASRLGIGSNGMALMVSGGFPSWGFVPVGVTSVALALPAEFSISGSPVTSTGTLTGAWANQAAHLSFVGPASGSATTPTFRQLTYADVATNAKLACRVVVTTNIASLSAPGGTLDGVAMAAGDRILLVGQSTGAQNGIWVWNGAAAALTRPEDYATGNTIEAFADMEVAIRAGTLKAGTTYRVTTTGAITIDTTATVWAQTAYNMTSGAVTGLLPVANGGTGVGSATLNGIVFASSTTAYSTSSNLTWNGSTVGVTGTVSVQGTVLAQTSASGTALAGQFQASLTGTATNLLYGVQGWVIVSGSSSSSFSGSVSGVRATIQHTTSGAISSMGAITTELQLAAPGSNTIAEMAHIMMLPTSTSGTQTVTKSYGLYINGDIQGAAAGSNYAIRTKGGLVDFGDHVQLQQKSSVSSELRLFGASTFYTGFVAPTLAATSIYTMPTGFPVSNMVLQSTSAGVLSWVSALILTNQNAHLTLVGPASGAAATPTFRQLNFQDVATANKLACRVATSTNTTLSAPGATIDGVTMAAGDRVLLTGQSTGSQNGIWVWNAAAFSMSRPEDYAAANTVEAFFDMEVEVREGTTNAGTVWRCTTTGAITIDTTATAWASILYGIASGGTGITSVSANAVVRGNSAGTAFASNTQFTYSVTGGMVLTTGALAPVTVLTVTGQSGLTGMTASTEIIDINFNLAHTVQWATGALTTQRAFVVQAPTYGFVGSSTVTTAATFAITGAPIAGTNATLTSTYALWVQTGKLQTAATTTTVAGLNLPHGTAPTSPVDGDVWTTTSGLLARINGATVTMGTIGGSVTGGQIAVGSGTNTVAGSASLTYSSSAGLGVSTGALGSPTALTVTGQTLASAAATTEVPDVNFNLARTVTWSAGAITTQRAFVVQAPTYAFGGASVITTAATVAITGAPVAGTNATLTNSYALWIQAGKLQTAATASGGAGLNLPHGTAPSSPVDGDLWTTTSGLLVRINGTTVTMGTIAGAATAGQIAFGSGTNTISSSANFTYGTGSGLALTTSAVALATAFTVTGQAFPSVTASTENIDVNFALNRTVTWSTGTLTTQRAFVVQAPTYAFGGASTLTTAATFAITGAPIAGTNATLTNTYALWVQSGSALLAGSAPLIIAQTAATTGTPNVIKITGGAHTTLNASSAAYDLDINLNRSIQFNTGNFGVFRVIYIQPPTIGFVGSSSVSIAATVSISGAPGAGTNATITNAYSLYVESGAIRSAANIAASDSLSGALVIGNGTNLTSVGIGGGKVYIGGALYACTNNTVANVGNVPVWVSFFVTAANFSTAALTNTITLFTASAGMVIHSVKMKHSTAFSGAGWASYTVSVGIAGTVAKYAPAFDVFQAVSATAHQHSSLIGGESHTGTTAITVTATSTGANLNTISATGTVQVWVLVSIPL